MKRQTREHGRILSVETKFRGDALAADALAGATTLVVSDAGDFDEDGGWLTINGQVVEYAECDDDEGTITLATGLTTAAEQGDAVHLWSTFYEEAVDYQEILVELDGEYDNPESVVAELADGLPDLPEGDRGEAGESCTLLRVSDDEWEVVNVGGRPRKASGHRSQIDQFEITDADTAAFTLSQSALEDSWNVTLNGVTCANGDEYAIGGTALTVVDAADLFAGASGADPWLLQAQYDYLVAGSTPVLTSDPEGIAGVQEMEQIHGTTVYPVPPETVAGDLLVLGLSLGLQTPTSVTAGWTKQGEVTDGSGNHYYVYSKIAEASDPGVTVTASGTTWMHGVMVAIRGANVASATADTSGATSTTYTTPSGPSWNLACIWARGSSTSGFLTTTPEEDYVEAGTDLLFGLAHTTDGSGVQAQHTSACLWSSIALNVVGA